MFYLPTGLPARQFRRVPGPSHPTQKGQTAMAQAIMDPEEVRRFAEELKRFNQDLQNRTASLHARFNALGESWQDQEHLKFAEEFNQATKALKKFLEASNQHSTLLLRKAQRIEDYLGQR
ncbi:MAG: WXG100 family type VII secretion target [Verrucomicrobiales bacterium]